MKVRYRFCRPGAAATAGYKWVGGLVMPCEWREHTIYEVIQMLVELIEDGTLTLNGAKSLVEENIEADEETKSIIIHEVIRKTKKI